MQKYEITENILGRGKFGIVKSGINKKTKELVAIKMGYINSPINALKHEATVLNYLYSRKCRCVPIIYWYGLYEQCPVIVMPLYTISLATIYSHSQKGGVTEKNMDNIDRIMAQLIGLIEIIHDLYIIHRDLKPENIMYKKGEFIVIDFGLATSYMIDDVHILQTDDICDIIGSPKYMSMNVHAGITPTRRDDMISLGYIYLYMKGCYNINSVEAKTMENIANIAIFPDCEKIIGFLDEFYRMGFDERPDYAKWKSII